MTRSVASAGRLSEPVTEIDMRALVDALKRRRRVYLVPTLVAFVLVTIFVNVVPARYTATSQVLLENQETFFTRPDRIATTSEQASQLDETAVASQVQLISSPDIARRAIKQLGLKGDIEFDPLARGMGPLKRVLVLLGLARDPTRQTAEERITQTFLEKLSVFSPTKTRVITIQFTSRNPELAARTANLIADLYIQEQSSAKRKTARGAAESLAAQIADLRVKLATADDDRERYRLQSGLLAGSNNMTISGQQLAELNSDLSKARSIQADAQAKSSMIRDLVKAGKAADVAEVVNNDIVRRLWDQRAVAQAQLALESRTLLAGHPRIKELTGQVAQFDLALKSAAKQAAATLENEAKIASSRVANLEAVLSQQKRVAGVANTDEIKLRALERAAQSLKEQLESSTTKYQEALARETSSATPADARIISNATEPQEPSFPKKLPFIIFGTLATLVLTMGFVVASELLSGRASVDAEAIETIAPSPVLPELPETTERAFRERRASRFFDEVNRSQPDLFEPVPLEPVPSEPRPSRRIESLLSRANVTRNEGVREVPDANAGPNTAIGGLFAAALGFAKRFGRSAEASRSKLAWNVKQPGKGGFDVQDDEEAADLVPMAKMAAGEDRSEHDLAAKIVAAHVPGRGVQIVGTLLGDNQDVAPIVDLARALAARGRAVIVDLNRTPAKLAALAQNDGNEPVMAMHGLADLLAGDASFAEVIHRDGASRLHFIPTGLQEADFRDFDLILDALSETYDFIILLAPDYPASEIAKVMAPYADFVVLTAAGVADGEIGKAETDLREAGARDILHTERHRDPEASVKHVA